MRRVREAERGVEVTGRETRIWETVEIYTETEIEMTSPLIDR